MFGITLFDFVRFIMQVGLAFAGASALWGLFFELKKKEKLVSFFLYTLYASLVTYFLALLILIIGWPAIASAHEGISLVPEIEFIKAGFSVTKLPALFMLLLVPLSRLFKEKSKLSWYFGIMFFLIFGIMAFQNFNYRFNLQQVFFSVHSIHSIFTLGTILVVDYLFIISMVKPNLKADIYPYFGVMSAVVWLGLGMDFLSVYPIFNETFISTPKFYFAQTVIAILIINGALLSGRLSRVLLDSIKGGKVKPLPGKWEKIAGVSASVSIVSWLTITFIDFSPNLTLSYMTLLLLYVFAIFIAYSTENVIMQKVTKG